MGTRRDFLKKTSFLAGSTIMSSSLSPFLLKPDKDFGFKISLAEWCHNREIFSGEMDHLDFPIIAKKNYGIDAVEYVNQFFADKANDQKYLKELKKRADEHGVRSVLIMIDNEGPVSSEDDKLRLKAVENHYKWVEAAKYLECDSIRINLFGAQDPDEWIAASVDGLGKLAEFGAQNEIAVIVENHGSHSSHGARLAEVMKQVNSKWTGTLPDFGNFCVARENGAMWNAPCIEQYDVYKGTEEMMPYAKGVSAKTFDFDDDGNEKNLDYMRLFQIIKDSGFNGGYVGIEYEGEHISPAEGILLTKKLLEKIRANLK
tara:strand:+ start:19547 stop:20494 length:948 start_codon:yes stop_codon:yes gene_type:complete